jgi:hypothetical protein
MQTSGYSLFMPLLFQEPKPYWSPGIQEEDAPQLVVSSVLFSEIVNGRESAISASKVEHTRCYVNVLYLVDTEFRFFGHR